MGPDCKGLYVFFRSVVFLKRFSSKPDSFPKTMLYGMATCKHKKKQVQVELLTKE